MIDDYKSIIKNNLPVIKEKINEILSGENLDSIEPILNRINSTKELPHWYVTLKTEDRLPNLDGKTVGSVLEKLLVCVLEKYILNDKIHLSINPAKGVDIPELELGVKSPSTNFCTSEPYFSAYERLLGNEYDALIMLTNYQEAKTKSPFILKIMSIEYLDGTEIADSKLCAIAKNLRAQISDEPLLKKSIRFLSYINQSDWEANQLLNMINSCVISDEAVDKKIKEIEKDFIKKNEQNEKLSKPLIPEECLSNIKSILTKEPKKEAIINVADNWTIQSQKDNGRFPNDNEWHRFMSSPLNGRIGMSFALQWRYNFSQIFSGFKK